MANKKDDDLDMGLDLDEFFPLNDDLDKSGKETEAPGFVSYVKNLGKTAKFGLETIAKATVPEAVELVQQLGMAKDTGIDMVRDQIDKVSDTMSKKKTGKSIKETISSFKKDILDAVKTGDFTLGANDADMSFGFDDSMDSEPVSEKFVKASEEIVTETRKGNDKVSKISIALEKTSQMQNAKLYSASQMNANARHMQSMGYMTSIDSNVSKIARYFATVGADSVAAQIEYSRKGLALQEDNVRLLNTIREQTYTAPNADSMQAGEGKLSSIFGGGLDGSNWIKNVGKNIGETIEYSPIGAVMSGLGMMNDMGGTAGMGKTLKSVIPESLFKMIPGLLLNNETRMKLENFGEMIPNLPGIMNAKFNQMAMSSENPLLRSAGSLLGIKELSTRKVDLGVKDLKGKALFDHKFYRSVTDAIPGLLSKILASQTGSGEVYYDFKSGTFKKGEHAVRQYKYERDKAYQSSFKYNAINDQLADQSNDLLKAEEPDLNDTQREEKAKIMRKDFKTIADNIASVNVLFSPDLLLENEGYQKLITEGLIDKKNFAYFVKAFGEGLKAEDKTMFGKGSQEVRQNIGNFNNRTVPELVNSGSGGSFLSDYITDERIKEQEKLLKYTDVGKHYDVDNPIQRMAKMKYLQGVEEIQIKHGGRAGTISGGDITDIGEISKKGVGETQIGVMNNIYELLLGGILVYPKGDVPKHLSEKLVAYNLSKEDAVEDKRNEIERKEFEDTEMRRARKEQQALKYKSEQTMKSMGREFIDKRFGKGGAIKDKVNDRVQTLLEKVNDGIFTLMYGRNESKNENIESYNEKLIKEVEESSSKLADNIGILMGKRGSGSISKLTSEAVVKRKIKEEEPVTQETKLADRIRIYIQRGFKELEQDVYGGKVDYKKLSEIMKTGDFGEVGELEKVPEARKLVIPDTTDNSQITTPVNVETKTQKSLMNFMPDKVSVVPVHDEKMYKFISKMFNKKGIIETKIYDRNHSDNSIDNGTSISISSSINALHDTNKQFFKTIIDSGIIQSIVESSKNSVVIRDKMTDVIDNLQVIMAKSISGGDSAGVDAQLLKILDKKINKTGFLTKILRAGKFAGKTAIKVPLKGASILGNILSGLGIGTKGVLGGAGKGLGTMFGGVGKLAGSMLGLAGSAVGGGAKLIGKAGKAGFNTIFGKAKKGSLLHGTGSLIKNTAKATGSVIKGGGGAIGGILSGAGRGLGGMMTGAGKGVGGVLGGLFGGGKDGSIDPNDLNTPSLDELKSRPMTIKDILTEILYETKLIRTYSAKSKQGLVSSILGAVGGIIKAPVNAVKGIFGGNKKEIDEDIKLPLTAEEISKEDESVFEVFNESEKPIENNTSTSAPKPKSGKKTRSVRKYLKDKKDKLKKVLSSKENAVTTATSIKDSVINKSKELFEKAKDLATPKGETSKKVTSLKDNIISGSTSVKDSVVDKARKLADKVKEKMPSKEEVDSIKKDVIAKATSLKDDVISGVVSTKDSITDKTKELADKAKEKMPSKEEISENIDKIKGQKVKKIKTIIEKIKKVIPSKESITKTTKSIKNKFDDKIKSVKDAAKNIIPIPTTGVKLANETEPTAREGSFLDQRKDARDELMLNAEVSMDKNISEILGILKKGVGPGKGKVKKEEKEKEKSGNLFTKAGGFAGAGLAAGAALLGTGLYKSTIGKAKLAKQTGLDEYGTAGDKLGAQVSLDASSKYGYDGTELSFGQRSSQSASLTHAPQAVSTAKGMYNVGKKLNKAAGIVPNVAGKLGGKKIGLLAKIATDIPGTIIGLFGKLFSAGPVKKLVSSKMATSIKGVLAKILKPAMFKGIGSKIAKKLAMVIGPLGVGMTVNDFITGMSNTNRYFTLGKGAKPNLAMRVISGVVNVLSSFLFGLIPADIIVNAIYSVIGSEEEREYIAGFKKFTQEKAAILDVPAGPLGEFETKNFWQRMFGSGKRDAGTLSFGMDKEGLEKFKTWRDDKYKPVEELRQKISDQYGGDNVVGKIPSSDADKQNQEAYRTKFLSTADDLVKSIDKTKEVESSEKPKDTTKPVEDTKLSTDKGATPPVKEATVAGVAILGASKVNGDKSADVSISSDTANSADDIKLGMKESDSINSAVGIPPADALNPVTGAVASVAATAIGGISSGGSTKVQEPAKINKDDFKLTNNEEEKSGIGSPALTDIQSMTTDINTELDALRSIYAEQTRHNTISEDFYESAIKLISILVETGKASFDNDKSRNEILAKSFLIDVDPKFKRFMRKNTDTTDMRTDSKTGKVEGEGFLGSMFGGKKNNPSTSRSVNTNIARKQTSASQIALGPAGSNSSESSSKYDVGEKAYNPTSEIDMSSYGEDLFNFDDKPTEFNDDLPSLINGYKSENPAGGLKGSGSPKDMSNYIQNSISGTNSTHELYQGSIPVLYKGKRIGLKYIYIPKADKDGMRNGDVISEIRFVNGEKQYAIDNTEESTMSLGINFSKGKFGKGANGVLVNMNVNNSNDKTSGSSPTAKMAEIVSNGGR